MQQNVSEQNPSQEESIFTEADIIGYKHRKSVRNARIALYAIGGIQLFFGVYSSMGVPADLLLYEWMVTFLLAAVFFVLGY